MKFTWLKNAWAWLKSWFKKEEPKVAAAFSNLPGEVDKATTWLGKLNTAAGNFFKALLGHVLDVSKWWTLIKLLAKTGAVSAALGAAWLNGHSTESGADKGQIAELTKNLASLQTQLVVMNKNYSGAKADLSDAQAMVKQQDMVITQMQKAGGISAKTPGNTKTGSVSKPPKKSASAPWYDGMFGN